MIVATVITEDGTTHHDIDQTRQDGERNEIKEYWIVVRYLQLSHTSEFFSSAYNINIPLSKTSIPLAWRAVSRI